jgi:diadenosine tetraphosphate (Ap4A) HIT family hydrolase
MTNQNPKSTGCLLCEGVSEESLFADEFLRVVLVTGDEAIAFPGFCRVVWKRHVGEMSDLQPNDQRYLMNMVLAVERAVRSVQQPDKMNIASLGNVVPHLHWHIIPRWEDDSHFPSPIWSAARRPVAVRRQVDRPALHDALMLAINAGGNEK